MTFPQIGGKYSVRYTETTGFLHIILGTELELACICANLEEYHQKHLHPSLQSQWQSAEYSVFHEKGRYPLLITLCMIRLARNS